MRLLRKGLKTPEVKKDISAQRRGFAKAWEHELMMSIKNSEHGVHAKGKRRGNLKLHLTLENHMQHYTKGRGRGGASGFGWLLPRGHSALIHWSHCLECFFKERERMVFFVAMNQEEIRNLNTTLNTTWKTQLICYIPRAQALD